jgi:hypothetical protein
VDTPYNTNKAGKIFPLSLDDLKRFSPGAIKVVIARWYDPEMTKQQLAEATGYSTRQIENLLREISEKGIVTAPTVPRRASDLTDEQRRGYDYLISFGFDVARAIKLAWLYPPTLINAGISYVNGSRGVNSPRGLLISWLAANAPHSETYTGREYAANHYERFWDK